MRRSLAAVLAAPALRGSLAQLVEHRAFNPLVLGSNPRRPTTYLLAEGKRAFPNSSKFLRLGLALPEIKRNLTERTVIGPNFGPLRDCDWTSERP